VPKVTLTDITSGYDSASAYNANNDRIEAGFDNTLSRDGTSPNQMNADLDMNSRKILNLPAPASDNEPARWVDVKDGVSVIGEVIPSQTGNTSKSLTTDGTSLFFKQATLVVDTLSDLLSADTAGNVSVNGYHSAGDGGGGEFYWDASQDKANHNGGTILDPDITFPTDWTNQTQVATWFTAATGTGCWVRIHNDKLSVKMFGAKGDSTTNDLLAIKQAIAYCFSEVSKVDATLPGSFGYKKSDVQLDFIGDFAVSGELFLYPGFVYYFPAGSTITATTAGQTVFRTTSAAERGDNYYSSKVLKLVGGGTIDGDDLATIGIQLDTIAQGSEIDVSVIRCSYRRGSTTGTGSSGSDQLTLAATTNFQALDVIQITGEDGEYYTIEAISGSVATLDRTLTDDVSGSTVTVRGVGISGNMAQQSLIKGSATHNDIGVSLGTNKDGFRCTDMDVRTFCEYNNIGMLILSGIGNVSNAQTMQHSFNSELIIGGGVSNIFVSSYVESNSDADADALNQPGIGSPVSAATLRGFPLISIRKGASNQFVDLHWPINSGSTTWRRVINNTGVNTIVNGVLTTQSALPENPSRPAVSGTTTSAVANKLVDSGATFTTDGAVFVGARVVNTTDSTSAKITAIDSNTQLSLSANIFGSAEDYTIRADQAPFEQNSSNGNLGVYNITGPTTVEDIEMIVDESGVRPATGRGFWSVIVGPRMHTNGSGVKNYLDLESDIYQSVYLTGEGQARLELRANGIRRGDGSAAPVQVVGDRVTGWTAATGTATRTGFATSTATTEEVAQALKALIDDLISHGLIGT